MHKLLTTIALGLAVWTSAMAVQTADTTLYHEPYRPQYHFSPAHRWIGDPCGLIRYDGKYLSYSWGGAESTDLLHWTETSHNAIKGTPKGIAQFTGSVVVDKNNTAGYGRNALVAAFTSFDEATKKQSQSIAFSRDGGRSFQYYDQNPVVDIWSTEFRDPTVIWDETSGRWIMLVAKALEKKVAFYGSPDLKHWEWLSDFGPMGDAARSWECPDMVRVPVEGTDSTKWVLIVSINWAREQYFVGDFDGTRFIAQQTSSYPLYIDDGLDYYASRVFQNYDDNAADTAVYTLGWVNTWDYAQQAPSTYGKGLWSLPRRLVLRPAGDGLRLCQLPAPALRTLRQKPHILDSRLKAGVTPLRAVSAMDNVYELDVTFESKGNDTYGLNLCCGDGRQVVVSYNTASQYLTVDRTNSTDADMPACYDRICWAKVPAKDGRLSLDIFVDHSVIEIFTEDGQRTFTLLTYAAPDQTGAELFSLRGNTKATLKAYPLTPVH